MPSFLADALAARKVPGVVNVMQAMHETDGRALMLQVQAMVLRSGKPTVSLIVHLHEPLMGMPDFKLWLTGADKVGAWIHTASRCSVAEVLWRWQWNLGVGVCTHACQQQYQ